MATMRFADAGNREPHEPAGAVLIYDGECPVCSAYVRYLRLRESVGEIQLVNARVDAGWRERLTRQGLDLDEGMVLLYGGHAYHGSDCVHMLAMLSSPSGFFNRLNAAAFRRPRVARIMYPVLRAGRNTLLWLLGRKKINVSAQ